MEIHATKYFKKKAAYYKKYNPALYRKANKAIETFAANPIHPSLRLHKLTNRDTWSISVTRSIRITYQYLEDTVVLTDFGTHDDVYR